MTTRIALFFDALMCLIIWGAACRPAPEGGPIASGGAGTVDAAGPCSAWPELPRGQAEIEQMVRVMTRDSGSGPREVTAGDIRDALQGRGTRGVIAGWDSVIDALSQQLGGPPHPGSRGVLLVGCYHDSGGQIAAFRRLIGYDGVPGITAVVLEQLRATGRWRGVSNDVQTGDDALLGAFLESGDRGAFDRLRRSQRTGDYTAWRYGYIDEVMDLVASSRAMGVPVLGCDMPRDLQPLTGVSSGEDLDRLREIHCLAALRCSVPDAGRSRVAMLWGQEHVMPHGVPRFLEPGDVAVSLLLFGSRPGSGTVESDLARDVVIDEPVLLADLGRPLLDVLLLPDGLMGGRVERSRAMAEPGEVPDDRIELVVRSDLDGTFSFGDRILVVGPEPVTDVLPGLPVTYVFHGGGKTVVGRIEHWGAGRVELDLCPGRRETSIAYLLARLPRLE